MECGCDHRSDHGSIAGKYLNHFSVPLLGAVPVAPTVVAAGAAVAAGVSSVPSEKMRSWQSTTVWTCLATAVMASRPISRYFVSRVPLASVGLSDDVCGAS